MKKIVDVSATWMWIIRASILFVSASVGFAKVQKTSATSSQESPEALLAAAMEKMSTGVWSVNGTVPRDKYTIKLRGLLSGKNFDLTMEPR